MEVFATVISNNATVLEIIAEVIPIIATVIKVSGGNVIGQVEYLRDRFSCLSKEAKCCSQSIRPFIGRGILLL